MPEKKDDAVANKSLFASAVARLLAPPADALNRELSPAYAYGPEHKLAQLAATGTLQDAFYAAAETQLAEVLEPQRPSIRSSSRRRRSMPAPGAR
jgi:60 kDa SS-A/Ro ribonucleoprotein